MYRVIFILCGVVSICFSQKNFPHTNAHAHNDYEHAQPLWSAIHHGFISVEADVHLIAGKLLVSHNHPKPNAPTLQQLYLATLDSLLIRNGDAVYPNYTGSFYLMIDCKTEAESTYRVIQKEIARYTNLRCTTEHCPIKIFISGNRAVDTMIREGYQGIALDGRPADLDKGISSALMPVISDHFSNWSSWKGHAEAHASDLVRIRALAQRVHAEGKKLRLWAIPDNEIAWAALLEAGVDFINTDRLQDLNLFLSKRGL